MWGHRCRFRGPPVYIMDPQLECGVRIEDVRLNPYNLYRLASSVEWSTRLWHLIRHWASLKTSQAVQPWASETLCETWVQPKGMDGTNKEQGCE